MTPRWRWHAMAFATLLVVDENRLIGIVTEHDLFTLQRVSMRQINEAIADAPCATWSPTSKAVA